MERGHKNVVDEQECLSWLNSKKPNLVLNVCFGSGCRFPNEQLMEIAYGLEASGHQFIWVVLGKDDEKEKGREKEREKERGRERFLNHYGWNLVLESVRVGALMITWPLYAKQLYNKKLVTHVLGIGVEVGAKDWNLWLDIGKKMIRSESVEKGVRRLMDDGDGVVEMRQKAKQLREKAKRAVGESWSSYRNLTILIEEIKKLRDHRVGG
ncbi:hypothetical protein F0562_012689 [Nyssa sinensis]|uniref:UDP-glycosyltransferases domain-containing protein n=1 Tax=Nyssa sinensis TaxID=561372 RepID=A0A5J4ZY80_9ASTE|nr:hypothetical protein F0562_012689 [Nyssa sinensis]